LEVLNNFDPRDADRVLSESKRIFKEHVKDWWSRGPTNVELNELSRFKTVF